MTGIPTEVYDENSDCLKLLWFPFVAEPNSNSGKTRRCGAKLHHLHWISSVRHLRIHQLDHLRVYAVSLTA